MPVLRIRDGKFADLAHLCEIESAAFAGDRLSLRSFRRLIGRPSARIRVAIADGAVVGYNLVLTRAGSTVARLYSIAVAASARGQGYGDRLLADAERQAERAGATALRLEVRRDNTSAIHLYERRRYRAIGTYPQYYADGCDARRYEKSLPRRTARHAGQERGGGDTAEDRSPAACDVFPRFMKPLSFAARGRLAYQAFPAASVSIRVLADG
jgi:ribosomal-protein-alanine N-acetyltransferase